MLMLWSLAKSWAKEQGYISFREKTNDKENQYDYYWGKEDNPTVTGLATSVSKLTTQIYNHMTSNQHLEYQIQYKESLSKTDINHNGLSAQW
jgi:hypothetical protein